MNEELKPCPFCGHADIRRHQFGDFRSVPCCTECGVAVIGGDWNHRAKPAAQAVPEGWKLVPEEPTEEMWGGLARTLMQWLDFGTPTVEALRKHLDMLNIEWPDWMDDESEMKSSGVPSKGTRATLIYKAMLAAAPTPPAAYDDGYYIQSNQDYAGNCLLWWRKGGGYTTHIDEAEVFTKEVANELLSSPSVRNDKPWPVSVVRAAATLQVDMQRLRDTPPAGGCLVADRKMSLQEAHQWVEELGPEYRLPSNEELK